MPSMFSSTFDGRSSSNRSRDASRHRDGRSHGDPDPFNFVSFMNDFAANLQEGGDSSRGGHAGYRTEEFCPRDRSHSPSPPHRRGRVASNYETEEIRPRDHFRSSSASPPSRRPRSPSPISYSSHFKDARRNNAPRARSPDYNARGRSPSPTPHRTYGKYSQASGRSPSPPYETRISCPSPPRSNEKYGRAPRRSPSPVRRSRSQREASPPRPASPLRRARTQRESSPTRPRPGTSDNSYGARSNDRYRAPSPRAYKTRDVSPPRASSQQRSSSAHNAGSRSGSRTRPAQERTPPKQSSKEKTSKDKKHWYSKFTTGKKSDSKRSSSKQREPRREEAKPQDQPRPSSRRRPDTAGFENFKREQRSSSARPQESRRGGADPKAEYNKRKKDWRQNERSPSPVRRPHNAYKTEDRKPSSKQRSPPSSEGGTPPKTGYNTKEHRPDWAEDSFPGAGPKPSSGFPPFNSYAPPKPAAPSKPAPTLSTLKKLFDAYNGRWESMSRIDPKLPMPASWSELKAIDFNGGQGENVNNHSDETIVVANLQVIFLAGFGLMGTITRYAEGLVMEVQGMASGGKEAEIKELGKWLSRKEQPRWHPDRINLRTGKEGVIDEGISKKTCVVAMRSAVQALLAVVT